MEEGRGKREEGMFWGLKRWGGCGGGAGGGGAGAGGGGGAGAGGGGGGCVVEGWWRRWWVSGRLVEEVVMG